LVHTILTSQLSTTLPEAAFANLFSRIALLSKLFWLRPPRSRFCPPAAVTPFSSPVCLFFLPESCLPPPPFRPKYTLPLSSPSRAAPFFLSATFLLYSPALVFPFLGGPLRSCHLLPLSTSSPFSSTSFPPFFSAQRYVLSSFTPVAIVL